MDKKIVQILGFCDGAPPILGYTYSRVQVSGVKFNDEFHSQKLLLLSKLYVVNVRYVIVPNKTINEKT